MATDTIRKTNGWMGRGLATVLALMTAAGGISVVPAAAEQAAKKKVIEKFTPAMVGETLQSYGLSFETQRDRSGDPLLIVKPGPLVHDQGMAVIFYGCDGADACDTFSLYTFFKTDKPLEAEKYHIWNDIFRIRTWTKAFQDSDGDTCLVLNVNAVGGVGRPSLEFLFSVFLTEVNAFRDAIQGKKTATKTDGSVPSKWVAAFDKSLEGLGAAPGTGGGLVDKGDIKGKLGQ
ncbi:MAG: YbjN domain-containing protein [Alphaproteobacteria bacterium]